MKSSVEPVVQLLSDLVAIPSMNPMGQMRTGKEYAEGEIAAYVAHYLRSHAVDVEIEEVSPERPNVKGLISRGAQGTVLLEAHLDTVQADSMTVEPFRPVVRDGRLHGRGSCDTKGSLAAFLQACIDAVRQPSALKHNVVALFVCDEEFRFTGAEAAVRSGLRADMGIVGEPTRLRIVRAHKGVTRWRAVTLGRAAHSAYPDRGSNAIYAMAPILRRLEVHASGLMKMPPHPLLGTPTLSVGVIEGGDAVNVVPDRCRIDIDRRTLPGESAHEVVAAVRDLLIDLPQWKFEEPYLSVAGMEVPEGAPVVGRLSASVAAVTGEARIEAAPYATDAGIYNRAGIPTVVFGPGDIAQAHTEDEFIELDQLRQAVAIVHRFLTT